jgi:hypothetical protein
VPADAKKLYYRIELRFIPCGSATPVMTQLSVVSCQLVGRDRAFFFVYSCVYCWVTNLLVMPPPPPNSR